MSLAQSVTSGPGKILVRCLRAANLPASSQTGSQSRIRPHARHTHQSQCRLYASVGTAPSVYRKNNTKSRPAEGLIFSQQDVPPLGFWEQRVSMIGPEGLTGEACFKAAIQYCDIAIRGVSTWKGRLEKDHGIDQYTLHYAALSLISGNPGSPWKLGLHMLRTASDLDYVPSILTLVSLLTKTEFGSSTSQHEMYQNIMPQFDKIVRSGRNPDALTLQGILLRRQQQGAEALAYFDRAIKAAAGTGKTSPCNQKQVPAELSGTKTIDDMLSPATRPLDDTSVSAGDSTPTDRAPRWSLEVPCYLERGRLLLQEGRKEDAEASFRVAALELDTADAYLELAQLLPEGMQDREDYLLKAAVSLNQKACLMLGEAELQKSHEADPSDAGKRDHQTKASEWFQLAGQSRA